jgi:hypothetical protein
MFDGETSRHVKLHPKLTTFDISALPEDGPATAMVMVVANAWLMGMLTRDPGHRTNFIAEEGWHLLGGPRRETDPRQVENCPAAWAWVSSPPSTTSPTSPRTPKPSR